MNTSHDGPAAVRTEPQEWPPAYFAPAPDVDTGIRGGPILLPEIHDGVGNLNADEGRYVAVVNLLAPSSQKLAAAILWSDADRYIEVIDVTRGRLSRAPGSKPRFVTDVVAADRRDAAVAAAGGIRLPLLVDTQPDRWTVTNDVYALPWRIGAQLGDPSSILSLSLAAEDPGVRARRLDWERRIFRDLHAGVYRAGFLESQSAYEEQVAAVAQFLADADAAVRQLPYLGGEAPGLADLWAFSLLVRFDHVYGPLFRLHSLRLTDYPALLAYARRLYRDPVLRATTDFDAITIGYYHGIRSLRRSVVPLGVRDRYLLDELTGPPSDTTKQRGHHE